jgi:hypothetical protein
VHDEGLIVADEDDLLVRGSAARMAGKIAAQKRWAVATVALLDAAEICWRQDRIRELRTSRYLGRIHKQVEPKFSHFLPLSLPRTHQKNRRSGDSFTSEISYRVDRCIFCPCEENSTKVVRFALTDSVSECRDGKGCRKTFDDVTV